MRKMVGAVQGGRRLDADTGKNGMPTCVDDLRYVAPLNAIR